MSRFELRWCAALALGSLSFGASAWAGTRFQSTIDTFGVVKTGHFVQVSPGVVGTQSFDFLAEAIEVGSPSHDVQLADFKYVNQDSIPNSVGMPEGPAGSWVWDDPAMYGNEAAMDYFYTSANDYTFRMTVNGLGAFEEAIDGPSDLYPDVVPKVNNYTALQSAVPNMAIPVLFDGFGNVGAVNVVRVAVMDGPTPVWSGQGLNTDTSLDIPGGVLAPNHAYNLFLTYETYQSYADRTAYFPDALAEYTFAYETKLSLVTGVPGAGSVAAFGVGGVWLCRRRRRA